ncbi:MAG: 5'-methylthioadenosine/adenosylhomocysteine nucleosidase [Treponema sp.]
MERIGIIGAMEVEVALLREKMEKTGAVNAVSEGGLTFFSGSLDGKNVTIVKSGVGKVNAALCVQHLILRLGAECVINTGIAGAAAHGLGVFDMVVSSDAVYHDMDATAFGYKPCQIPQMDTWEFKADEGLISAAQKAFIQSEFAAKHKIVCGRVATGDQFVGDKTNKARIVKICSPACIEMEGAAIAHACVLNATPFVILRCISDMADDSYESTYDFNEETAARQSAAIVEGMLKFI